MPTIARLHQLRVVIYFNDHRPAHVHVIGSGEEAVFNLNCPHGPPVLHENFGFTKSQIYQLRAELSSKLPELCKAWRDIHGAYS
jgi:hypothetical protein